MGLYSRVQQQDGSRPIAAREACLLSAFYCIDCWRFRRCSGCPHRLLSCVSFLPDSDRLISGRSPAVGGRVRVQPQVRAWQPTPPHLLPKVRSARDMVAETRRPLLMLLVLACFVRALPRICVCVCVFSIEN